MHETNCLNNGSKNGASAASAYEHVAPDTRFVVIKEHLYSDLNGEAVVLSVKNGKYYGLNGVGRCIWKAIREPKSLEEIRKYVMGEYEVDEATCSVEVSSFLRKMQDEGLVEVLDANTV